MTNLFGCLLMAAITFPLAFLIARSCLGLVLRIMSGGPNRDVL